ncbi:MAG TPA: DUF2252 domain-containing protein [Solirubrobacteraceae bacterium]|jgi:uncharacterized protein (DUF2252 family)|nr:DUF2252 domain-containing protein [Solirubrobacteraceae bacterium]
MGPTRRSEFPLRAQRADADAAPAPRVSAADASGWRPPPVRRDELAHPTAGARESRGRLARKAVPRSRHGEWEPAADRLDPIELLQEQARERVPELNPIRYGRMLVSPFAFFRGAAYVMASDLAPEPRTGLDTQLCGDAHLSNFGTFAGPDRELVFGLNDFDETLPGPFEWDVKRLVASLEVAGRDRGFPAKRRASIDLAAARAYREAMRHFAGLRTLDLWYIHIDRSVGELVNEWAAGVRRGELKRFERDVAKARTKDNLQAFAKLTRIVDGTPQIISTPPLIVPIQELAGPEAGEALGQAIREITHYYRRTLPHDRRQLLERYRYVDSARKVVGVGSVGTRDWIVLLLGRDEHDPLFLQMKEAQTSVLEPFLKKSAYANHGQRVVEGQRLLQGASDILLGWIRSTSWIDGENRDFYMRQLWDGKGSAPVEAMDDEALRSYGELCGWALARAHARGGDAIAIGAYLGSGEAFDRTTASFAARYADQSERDYEALKRAADSGRIQVQTGL